MDEIQAMCAAQRKPLGGWLPILGPSAVAVPFKLTGALSSWWFVAVPSLAVAGVTCGLFVLAAAAVAHGTRQCPTEP